MAGGPCMAEGCMVGCMHGRGACVAGGVCVAGGMCGGGVHGWGGRGAWQILRDTVNERAVRILLECILVESIFTLLVLKNRR